MGTLVHLDELVAGRAVSILQGDGHCIRIICSSIVIIPFLLNLSLNTLKMKDMFAPQLHHCLLPKARNIANHTVGVSIVTKCLLLVFGDTIFMKARRVFGLIAVAIARMTTFEKFGTAPM